MISSITFGGVVVSIISIVFLYFIISYISFSYPRKMPGMGAYYQTWDGVYIRITGLVFPGQYRVEGSFESKTYIYGPEIKISFLTTQTDHYISFHQFWKMVKVKVDADEACNKIQSFEDLIASDKISQELKKKVIFNMGYLK